MNTLRSIAIAPVALLCSLAFAADASAKPPGDWTCEEGFYGDDICDCGCAAPDPDCTMSTFEGCERSGCGAGKVPWEHAPDSCMTSACGDGWVDEAAAEVCDDGAALASGGCSADCKSVNSGWTCGENAEKCTIAAAEPGPEANPETSPEAPPEIGAEPGPVNPESDEEPVAAGGGCLGGEASALGLFGLFAMGLVRRRAV